MKATSNRSGPPSAALPPEAGSAPEPGAAGATPFDPVQRSLQEVDGYTQGHAERMGVLIRAAKALLSPNVAALMDVHELLDAMRASCADLENLVNCEADDHGCSYVDERRYALQRRFAATGAEVSRG